MDLPVTTILPENQSIQTAPSEQQQPLEQKNSQDFWESFHEFIQNEWYT